MDVSARRVQVEIGELVLENLGPCDGRAVAHSAERELERLLHGRDLPPMLSTRGEHRALHAPAFEIAGNAAGASLGVEVARAVYGAFER